MTESAESDETAVRRDRFSGGPARGFLSSLAADQAIFEADLAVDQAHVVMLAEQEIIEPHTAAEILDALDGIRTDGHGSLPEGEDVHEAIETAVIDRIGPEGGRMHTARSRNDEVAACIRFRLREGLLEVAAAVAELRDALTGVATEHVETVAPGYTHLQPAQPTTLAHLLLSYEQALARDSGRLLEAYDRVNTSPLGAAAFAGTPFDIDRHRTADLLGFDGIELNATDAVSGRDFLIESAADAAALGVTLSGLAEDLVIYANKGFVEIDDAYASTSSIMPQKKNPDTLELIRGTAGDSVGSLAGVVTTLKGLPRAYNRDLQRAHAGVFETLETVADSVDVAGGAVTTASWDVTALSEAAATGFSTATGVADRLAASGVPFRTAHEVVAAAAETSTGEVTPAALDTAAETHLGESLFAYLSRDELEAALDPGESVANRDSAGGPAPAAVRSQLTHANSGIDDTRDAVTSRRASLAEAADRRREEVTGYE